MNPLTKLINRLFGTRAAEDMGEPPATPSVEDRIYDPYKDSSLMQEEEFKMPHNEWKNGRWEKRVKHITDEFER